MDKLLISTPKAFARNIGSPRNHVTLGHYNRATAAYTLSSEQMGEWGSPLTKGLFKRAVRSICMERAKAEQKTVTLLASDGTVLSTYSLHTARGPLQATPTRTARGARLQKLAKKAHIKVEFSRLDYFQALALAHLSSVAHEARLLVDATGNEEAGDAFSGLHESLLKQASGLFPLWPHGNGKPQDDFYRWNRGQAWLRLEGIIS